MSPSFSLVKYCLFSPQIFKYLDLRDWLNCAEVCCTWKTMIQSGTLWSEVCTERLRLLLN